MKIALCPRCKQIALIDIGDGNYRCNSCGYMGKSSFEEDLFKKGKK